MKLTLCDSWLMQLVAVILIVGGAVIFALLGTAHAVFTLQSSPAGGPMTPTDPSVAAAMETPGGLGLAPHIDSTLWKAWAGFNLSHSVGAILAALAIAVPVVEDIDAAAGHWAWVGLALIVPPLYLVLSIRYWFDKPTQGISLATALVYAGTILALAT